MTFIADNGRIQVLDGDRSVFDTENKMPAVTGVISGSVSWDASNFRDEVFNIGNVDPLTEFILPTCVYLASSGNLVPGGIPVTSPGTFLTGVDMSRDNYIWGAQTVTFTLRNGLITFVKRGQVQTRDTYTCRYKIYTGRYI